MKRALILGCSHAAGNEIIPPGYDDPEKSFPMLVAKALGYNATNMAIIGGSNDAMFRIAEQHRQDYDIVIACWTGADRSEVWDGDSWQAIAPGGWPITIEEYRKQWLLHSTDFETSRFNKLKNILALNSMCSKVINIDSFYPVRNYKWSSDVYWPTPETFYDWCNKKNYSHTKFGHFFEDAHQAFANYLLERLDTKFIDNKDC